MNRDALGVLALATVTVLAIAVGAAAIDAPTRTAGTGGGSGGGSGGLFGEGSTFSLGQSSDPPTLGGGPPKLVFQVLIAVLVVGFLVALYLQRDEIGFRDLRNVAVAVAALGLLSIVFYYVIRSFSGSNTTGGNGTMGRATPAASGGGAGAAADTALQPVATNLPLVALVVGAALLVGLAVVFRSDDEGTPSESESEPDETTRTRKVSRTAGRAADRIVDGTDIDNEVYRAWHEMATQLDMKHPESSTPHEFARAATDAGMARDDVAELTDLFRAVRYGGRDVTDDHEARAVAALRRIEDEYAEEP
ncbi:DUF4129 domain-containing protein [Halococcus sp. AFM35]|uniref:DUF4129 domain-containing protein n=1 Tax=Halococcus sp. AFM35 TaxID=3421653 RepID=UPI003EBB9F07